MFFQSFANDSIVAAKFRFLALRPRRPEEMRSKIWAESAMVRNLFCDPGHGPVTWRGPESKVWSRDVSPALPSG